MPSLQQTLAASVRRLLLADPNISIISVSGPDGGMDPENACAGDEAVNKAENTTGGANWHAVNKVAKSISGEFPHVQIETLAYEGGTYPPQSLRFERNVIVRVCLNEELGSLNDGTGWNRFLPITDRRNAAAIAVLREWKQAVGTLFVWDHAEDHLNSMVPHPNYFLLGDRIKYLVDLGVTGYYTDGNADEAADMAALKAYVIGRISFDPALETAAVIHEFVAVYYGVGAGPLVIQYLELMAKAMVQHNTRYDIYGVDHCPAHAPSACPHWIGPYNAIFANETMLQAATLLRSATQAAAGSPKHLWRVAQAAMHVQYVILLRWDALRALARRTHTPWPLAATAAGEFEAFAASFNRSYPPARRQIKEFTWDARGGIVHSKCDLACLRAEMLDAKNGGISGARHLW